MFLYMHIMYFDQFTSFISVSHLSSFKNNFIILFSFMHMKYLMWWNILESLETKVYFKYMSFYNLCFLPAFHPFIYHLSIHPSSIYPSIIHLSIYPPIHPIHPLIHSPTHPTTINPSVHPPTTLIHPFTCPSIHPFAHLSILPSIHHPPVYSSTPTPSIHPLTHPSTHQQSVHPLVHALWQWPLWLHH
jgi:hypothetical protein